MMADEDVVFQWMRQLALYLAVLLGSVAVLFFNAVLSTGQLAIPLGMPLKFSVLGTFCAAFAFFVASSAKMDPDIKFDLKKPRSVIAVIFLSLAGGSLGYLTEWVVFLDMSELVVTD